ncbi:MAG: tetratricopeptide repeat protein [Thermodesulfobacteriota bacterium]
MADDSAFSKKRLETLVAEKQGLLEQLNVPPRAAAFLREHALKLQVAGVVVVLAVVGWQAFSAWQERTADEGAARLALALEAVDSGERQRLLAEVGDRYGSTGAGLWARLELGHLERQAGRLDEALSHYRAVAEELNRKSPLAPLVELALAVTLEIKGQPGEAMSHYQGLAAWDGFAEQACLGMGRLHEAQGALDQARQTYEAYLARADQNSALPKERVAERLARLKAQ